MQADVKESFKLSTTTTQLLRVQTETNSACHEAVNEAKQLLQETEQEEQNSAQMLNTAREIEEAAHAAMVAAEAVLLAAEARLAAAVAAEAAAVASMNPAAIASATAEVFSVQQAYQQAREAYELARKAYEAAKAHRELLEKRYEMARQALNLAQLMKAKLETRCLKCVTQIAPLVEQGFSRITQAHEDLNKYLDERTSIANLSNANISRRPLTFVPASMQIATSTSTPAQIKAFEDWSNYQPKLGEPIKSEELHARLNPSSEVMHGLLKERYRTDPKFHAQVDSYREQAKTDRAGAETKIKKNMVGGFAEEIVKGALKPYGGVHSAQERVYLPDGTYTKPDFILKDLKTPLILGRGKGMGVRENGSIAVEVKTGQSGYILSQGEHLQVQAQGHAAQDASWVIYTRDIREIEERKQQELRKNVKEAGSPIVGCLPYKSELDATCINFVFGDNNND